MFTSEILQNHNLYPYRTIYYTLPVATMPVFKLILSNQSSDNHCRLVYDLPPVLLLSSGRNQQ